MSGRVRRFKAHCVMDGQDGPLVWGTMRPTKKEAEAIYKKWNPDVTTGHAVQVEIRIFDNRPPETI